MTSKRWFTSPTHDARMRAENEAYNRLADLPASATDLQIAEAIMEWSLCSAECWRPTPVYHLHVLTDYRTFPFPMTSRGKGAVRYSTTDREAARDWGVKVLLAGHCLFKSFTAHSAGHGGRIADYRRRGKAAA